MSGPGEIEQVLDRFHQWWGEITRRELQQKTAFVAGIQPLCDATKAQQLAGKRPNPRIPEAMLTRLSSAGSASAQRAAGVAMAVETIGRLRDVKGLRGFQICVDGDADAALEVIEKASLGTN